MGVRCGAPPGGGALPPPTPANVHIAFCPCPLTFHLYQHLPWLSFYATEGGVGGTPEARPRPPTFPAGTQQMQKELSTQLGVWSGFALPHPNLPSNFTSGGGLTSYFSGGPPREEEDALEAAAIAARVQQSGATLLI